MNKYYSKIIERIPFIKKKTDEITALNEEIKIMKERIDNYEKIINAVNLVCKTWQGDFGIVKKIGNRKAISEINKIFNETGG
jgi:predicted SpoU family rRNA methylase